MMPEGMEIITLKTQQGHTAQVCTHGSHVISWKTPEGKELIFTSKKAIFAPPKAIRGGIPVCFPQFGMMGPLPTQHGFARNVAFEVERQEEWQVTMVLKYDGVSQPGFPHPFLLRIRTALCDNLLSQEVQVCNTGNNDFSFTVALHTYLRVQDISQVHITGLSGVTYLDNLAQQAKQQDTGAHIRIGQEVDRVYVGATQDIQVHDGGAGQVLTVHREEMPDAVVWNPWVDKAKSMADFDDEEYKEMVCIEAAVAASGPLLVRQGACWAGKQTISYAQKAA